MPPTYARPPLPPTPLHNEQGRGIKVGLLNVGGLASSDGCGTVASSCISYARNLGLDVLVITETHAVDLSAHLQLKRLHGVDSHFCNYKLRKSHTRGLHDNGRRVKGRRGVAILIINPEFKLSVLEKDEEAGVLTCRVTPRHGDGVPPLVITAVYTPDAAAELVDRRTRGDDAASNSNAASNPTLASASKAARYYGPRHPGAYLVMGDFNFRLGSLSGTRHTEDDGKAHGGRARLGRSFLHAANVAPLHGRTGFAPARMTSHQPSGARCPPNPSVPHRFLGFSEVDLICGGIDSHAPCFSIDTSITWPPQEWASTHLCLAVTIYLGAKPSAAQRRRSTLRRAPALQVPPYGHELWKKYAFEFNTYLATTDDGILMPGKIKTATPTRIQAALTAVCLKAATLSQPAHADAFNGLTMAAKAAMGRTLPGTNGTTRVPEYLASALRDVQVARNLYATTLQHPAAGPGAALAAKSHLRSTSRLAQAAERRFAQTFMDGAVDALCKLHKTDHLRMHQLLKAFSTNDGGNSASTIPDDPDLGIPAHERFVASFRALFKGGRAAPPAATSAERLSFVPSAGSEQSRHLDATVTAEDVFLCVFPASKRVQPTSCVSGCVLCKRLAEEWSRWDGTITSIHPPPNLVPHLHTSTRPGTDGVCPEHIVWGSLDDGEAGYQHKMKICNILAEYCNSILRTGAFPDDALHYRSVPLPKSGKPGQHVDLSDPDWYRFLTLGNTIPKVFDLVITRRITHWAVHNDLIDASQVGFMPGHSGEEHVFTLTETIKHMWRHDMDAYVLFVDFRKAYDKVHPDALYSVLRHMGVPERLVRVLQDRTSRRVTELTINGVPSGPIEQQEGVGQGDVLSPMLFNLFIESLFREIRRHGDFQGITIGPRGSATSQPDARRTSTDYVDQTKCDAEVASPLSPLNIRTVGYADDVAGVCLTTDQLAILVQIIYSWCVAWGMELSLGKDKTVAMAFPRPSKSPSALPTIILPVSPLPGAAVVPWTSTYRYLGYVMNSTLDDSSFFDSLEGDISTMWSQYFIHSTLQWRSPPAMTLEIFRTMISPNYLICILEPTDAAVSALHKATMRVARWAVGALPSFPRHLKSASANLMDARDHMLRERTRLYLKLFDPLFPNALASRLARLLQKAKPTITRRLQPWTHRTAAIFRAAEATFSVAIPAPSPSQAHAVTAAVYARSVSVERWLAEGKESLRSKLVQSSPCSVAYLPRGKPVEHCAALHDWYTCGHALFGDRKGVAPLGRMGPGGSGSLLALVTSPRLSPKDISTLCSLQTGRAALFLKPLAPTCPGYAQPISGVPRGAGWRSRTTKLSLVKAAAKAQYGIDMDTWRDKSHSTSPCTALLCDGRLPLDLAHVFFDCTAPGVSAARRMLHDSATGFIGRIAELCINLTDKLAGRMSAVFLPERLGRIASVVALAHATDWTSADGRWVLYRMLLVLPWTLQSIVDTPTNVPCKLARAMGAIFQNVCGSHHWLRPLANSWTAWASRQVLRVDHAWARAVEAGADIIATSTVADLPSPAPHSPSRTP